MSAMNFVIAILAIFIVYIIVGVLLCKRLIDVVSDDELSQEAVPMGLEIEHQSKESEQV